MSQADRIVETITKLRAAMARWREAERLAATEGNEVYKILGSAMDAKIPMGVLEEVTGFSRSKIYKVWRNLPPE